MSLPSGTNYDLATISNPGSALTDFTLIIDLSNCSASFKSAWNTNSNGYGRAAKSDGTELACDWIDLNYSSATGLVRVKWSGTLASSGTQQVRLYPPNTSNAQYAHDDTYGSDNAYASNILAYYPDGSGTGDRTVNGINGTLSNITAGDSSGKIGKATDYTGGSSDYCYNVDLGSLSELSVIAWLYLDAIDDWAGILFSRNTAPTGFGFDDASHLQHHWNDYDYSNDGPSVSTGSWIMCSFSHQDSEWILGINTSFQTGTPNNTDNVDMDNSYLGADPPPADTSRRVDGRICNVFIFNSDISQAWISHEYSQTNDNATFWGTWTWQGGGSGILHFIRNSMGMGGL